MNDKGEWQVLGKVSEIRHVCCVTRRIVQISLYLCTAHRCLSVTITNISLIYYIADGVAKQSRGHNVFGNYEMKMFC
jgi:hypothetical protein